MKLTDKQMLDHWRESRGFVSAHSGCSMELFDYTDLKQRLNVEMRQWYLHLLDHGDLRYIVLHDVAERLTLTGDLGGIWHARLPVDVRRLVSLTVSGAEVPVTVASAGSDVRRDTLNRNRFARSGRHRPTAFVNDDGTLTLFCRDAVTKPVILSAMAVVDPGDETYELDESALKLLYDIPRL